MMNLEKLREKKRTEKAPYLFDILFGRRGDYNIDYLYLLSVNLQYEEALKRQNYAPKECRRKLSFGLPADIMSTGLKWKFEMKNHNKS